MSVLNNLKLHLVLLRKKFGVVDILILSFATTFGKAEKIIFDGYDKKDLLPWS